jgi:hypothetical protein
MPDGLPDDLNPADHGVLAKAVPKERILGYIMKIFCDPGIGFDNMREPQLFLRGHKPEPRC